MSYSKEATRRSLPWWYLAIPFAAVTVWLLPYPWLMTDLHLWYLWPLWILTAQLSCAFSHLLVTRSLRKAVRFLKSSRAAWLELASFTHLQAALLVALAEETVFRHLLLWPLKSLLVSTGSPVPTSSEIPLIVPDWTPMFVSSWIPATASSWIPVFATSLLFAAAHFRPGRGWGSLSKYVDLFLLGLLLGTVTLETRSLYPAILMHGTRNYILRCLLISKAELEALRG